MPDISSRFQPPAGQNSPRSNAIVALSPFQVKRFLATFQLYLQVDNKFTNIVPPMIVVEINGKKVTGFIDKKWINADSLFSRQVIVYGLIGQRQEFSIIASGTLDLRLGTYATFPFVGTGWRIPGLGGRNVGVLWYLPQNSPSQGKKKKPKSRHNSLAFKDLQNGG